MSEYFNFVSKMKYPALRQLYNHLTTQGQALVNYHSGTGAELVTLAAAVHIANRNMFKLLAVAPKTEHAMLKEFIGTCPMARFSDLILVTPQSLTVRPVPVESGAKYAMYLNWHTYPKDRRTKTYQALMRLERDADRLFYCFSRITPKQTPMYELKRRLFELYRVSLEDWEGEDSGAPELVLTTESYKDFIERRDRGLAAIREANRTQAAQYGRFHGVARYS